MELGSPDSLTLIVLVVSGFIATNIDNLLLLVVLLGANMTRRWEVLLGYFCAAVTLIVVSLLGVVAGAVAGGELIGYLGLVPLVMGCYMLSGVVIEDGRGDLPVEPLEVAGERAVWLSTFILLFSNSGDSIAVFLPLLAESGGVALVLIVGSFLAMVFFWAGLSCLIAGQRMLAVNIEKRAQKIVPWVMIGVGIYILMDTATDTLV